MKFATLIAAAALSLTAVSGMAAGYGQSNNYSGNTYQTQQYQPQKQVQANGPVILVDPKGLTLYTFDNDRQGVSNCYDGCAVDWPPFYAKPDATDYGYFSVIQRQDGEYQWAYKGAPLYYWIGDARPGDTNGDGIGGVWHVALK